MVLKLLARALDDGDTIHAVTGQRHHNDGAVKVGYLAPGVDGQAAAVRAALRAGGVDARSISYVEAHGTGTRMGDPIEVAALAQALGGEGARARIGLGSVKSSIGHLGEAAGVASLIKAVLALSHRELPRTLGFVRPNPELELAVTPFYVQAEHAPWTGSRPLRCGVSALGVGGTNCHVILEEAPEPLPGQGARALSLLLVSAKDPVALARLAAAHAAHFEARPDASPPMPRTRSRWAPCASAPARAGRARSRRRAAQLRAPAAAPTAATSARRVSPSCFLARDRSTAGWARSSTRRSRRTARRSTPAIAVAAELGVGTLRAILSSPRRPPRHRSRARRARCLRCSRWSMRSRGLPRWGVTPSVLFGHSMGEYVAACGRSDDASEALGLVILRARLSESVGGAMLSVALDEAARARSPARSTWRP